MTMSIEDVAEVAIWAKRYMDKLEKEEKEKLKVIVDLCAWLTMKAAEALEEKYE